MEKTEILQLGGNIELLGFQNLDGATMIVLKKIVGTFARKFSDNLENFEKLSLNLNQEESSFNLAASLAFSGTEKKAGTQNPNLFFAVDQVLKELDSQ